MSDEAVSRGSQGFDVKIVRVAYGSSLLDGDHHAQLLRDVRGTPDGKWLIGTPCNEIGVADRQGCSDAEFVIRRDRVLAIREVA